VDGCLAREGTSAAQADAFVRRVLEPLPSVWGNSRWGTASRGTIPQAGRAMHFSGPHKEQSRLNGSSTVPALPPVFRSSGDSVEELEITMAARGGSRRDGIQGMVRLKMVRRRCHRLCTILAGKNVERNLASRRGVCNSDGFGHHRWLRRRRLPTAGRPIPVRSLRRVRVPCGERGMGRPTRQKTSTALVP